MKCPKCGYVGFEETDRCRHCGYDFSLLTTGPDAHAGADSQQATVVRARPAHSLTERLPLAEGVLSVDVAYDAASTELQDLPLRVPAFPVLVPDAPPPTARPPLAVRRASIDRPRSRATTHIVRRNSGPLLDAVPSGESQVDATVSEATVAPTGLRLAAAMVDVVALASIDLAVVYLTAQLAGVQTIEVDTLPLAPLGAFLLGLNVSYLAVFTAIGGQTLGKMAMGLRVVAVEGGLTPGDAMLRVGVALVGTAVAGAGFLPALVRSDGRAVHDYAARTRVVRVAR